MGNKEWARQLAVLLFFVGLATAVWVKRVHIDQPRLPVIRGARTSFAPPTRGLRTCTMNFGAATFLSGTLTSSQVSPSWACTSRERSTLRTSL